MEPQKPKDGVSIQEFLIKFLLDKFSYNELIKIHNMNSDLDVKNFLDLPKALFATFYDIDDKDEYWVDYVYRNCIINKEDRDKFLAAYKLMSSIPFSENDKNRNSYDDIRHAASYVRNSGIRNRTFSMGFPLYEADPNDKSYMALSPVEKKLQQFSIILSSMRIYINIFALLDLAK